MSRPVISRAGIAVAVQQRGLIRAAARTLLAVAQLGTLLYTSPAVLFARPPDEPAGAGCAGLGRLSLWCVTATAGGPTEVARYAAVLVLALVAIGYRPRWTCVPHYWVAFSLHASLPFPNGGEYAAQLATMFLLPVCLADRRSWQWNPVTPAAGAWRGAARAAQLVLRCQLLVIYSWAAAAKLSQPAWRDGSAMRAILRDPIYGAPSAVRHVTDRLLAPAPVAAGLTWSVLAVEFSIAVLVLCGRRPRWVAAVLALVLHAAVILLMGLFGFGLTMIAFVLLACAGGAAFDGVGQPAPPADDGRTRLVGAAGRGGR